MRSNLSKKDILSGQEIVEKLSKLDTKLIPDFLKEIVPNYQKFQPHPQKNNLWLSGKNKKITIKHNKLVILFSGLTASGKDAIFQEMQTISPNLFSKTITATSRPPRENEIHQQDYFFYQNSTTFIKSVKKGEFLEFIKRGETYYGLPKESINQSLKHSSPVIFSQIEMSGWSKLEKHIKKIDPKIPVLKFFVFPEMNFSEYQKWLSEKRQDNDLESRIHKTGWEIKKAAKKANFIIINHIEKNTDHLHQISKTIVEHISEFINF